jgi:hypothetical protein
LLTRSQIRTLSETGLHDFMEQRCGTEVAVIAESVQATYEGTEDPVPISEPQAMIATRLKAVSALGDEIADVLAEGGLSSTVTDDDLWTMLALWLIERQLRELPLWDPARDASEPAAERVTLEGGEQPGSNQHSASGGVARPSRKRRQGTLKQRFYDWWWGGSQR